MSRIPSLFIAIEDTPEQSVDDSGLDPLSDEDYSLFVEDAVSSQTSEQSDFLYGHFDSLFKEDVPPIQIVIPPSPKKTRLIQCRSESKSLLEACLRDFTENKDIVEVAVVGDNLIRFIADLSSEECILLNLASPVPSMRIIDMSDEAGE